MKELYGSGNYTYEEVNGWGELPAGLIANDCPDIYVDGRDRILAMCRTGNKIVEMTTDGAVTDVWTKDEFVEIHSVIVDDSTGDYYVTDEFAHTVWKLSEDRKLLMIIGTPGVPSTPETEPGKYLNRPTAAAIDDEKNIYVADGYGDCQIHKYRADGTWVWSIGEEGSDEQAFFRPHGISIYDGKLYVSDRDNDRIKVYTLDGELINIMPVSVHRPSQLDARNDVIYLCEMDKNRNKPDAVPSRISILKTDGEVLTRLEGYDGYSRGEAISGVSHGIAVDSEGNLYIADTGRKPESYVGIHKYRLVK